MKNFILIFVFIVGGFVNAQQVVFDPAVLSALTANHQVQNANLVSIKNSEGRIAAAQAVIATKMERLRQLEQKYQNSLTTVTAIVRDAKGILNASDIVADIIGYQAQMVDLGSENPELYAFALASEEKLIDRTYDLVLYVGNAVVGGQINMMNNAERMRIIQYVNTELQVMRGIAYGIVRKMKTAKYTGFWRTIFRDNFRPEVDKARNMNNTLRDMEAILNRF